SGAATSTSTRGSRAGGGRAARRRPPRSGDARRWSRRSGARAPLPRAIARGAERCQTAPACARRARMQLEFIRYEKPDRIAYVTVDRPDVMNALHPPANEELSRVWDDFTTDPDAWVAILTGAGDRAFSAGNDLKWTALHGVPRMPKGGFGGIVARDDLWKP